MVLLLALVAGAAPIDAVEARVDVLRERTFVSKAVLQLLREMLVEEDSAVVVVEVDDRTSGFYQLARSTLTVDGWPVEPGSRRHLSAGPHEVTADLLVVVRGGPFGYVNDIRFHLRSVWQLELAPGDALALTAAAFIRPFAKWEERVGLSWTKVDLDR